MRTHERWKNEPLEKGDSYLPRTVSTTDAVETLIDAHRLVIERLGTMGYVRVRYEARLKEAGIVLNPRLSE